MELFLNCKFLIYQIPTEAKKSHPLPQPFPSTPTSEFISTLPPPKKKKKKKQNCGQFHKAQTRDYFKKSDLFWL